MVKLQLIQASNLCLQFLIKRLDVQVFQFFTLHSLSVFIVITSNNKLCLYRQFLSCKTKSLFCNIETYSFNFKEDTTRCNRCDPSCWITLTLTHADISRFTCDWFIREYSDPYLTFTLHVAVHSYTCSFYLTAVNPFCLKCLDAKRSESQLCASVSVAFIATPVLRSSIFYSFWL